MLKRITCMISVKETNWLSALSNQALRTSHICYHITQLSNSISEPDGPPQSVQGQNSSSTSILVTWNEVLPYDRNGIITSYNITYKSQTENDNGNVLVNGSVRQTELRNLKEYVNYNITVLASTVKGDGPASDPIVVRTDQDGK